MTLDIAKSWFASNRSTVSTAINAFNVVNTAAYLTSAISDETYTVVLLSGMLGSMAYNLIDASVSYAGKGVSSITDQDAKRIAEQNVGAIKAKIAFETNPCLETFLGIAGFPAVDKLPDHWEVASFAGKVLPHLAKMKQNTILWRTFRWNFLIPFIFEQVIEGTMREMGKADEAGRDAETLDRWLAVLKALPPEETDHPIYKELEAKFGPTLTHLTALNPQMGLQYATAFHELTEKSLPKNEAAL